MFINKKKLDSYIKLIWDLKQENDVLKQQISKLQSENELATMYKKEYQGLVEQYKSMIKKLDANLKAVNTLENECKRQLKEIGKIK